MCSAGPYIVFNESIFTGKVRGDGGVGLVREFFSWRSVEIATVGETIAENLISHGTCLREHHGLAAASKQTVRRSLQDKWERTRTQASSWDKELNGECLIAGCRHRCRETHLLLRRTPLNLFGRSHVSWCALAAAAVATDLVLLRSSDATRGEPGRERKYISLALPF